MDMDEIKTRAGEIEGWLTEKEGELLCQLARDCRGTGVIVEIGSWKGKSTIWLACGSKQGASVSIYAIDPHAGSTPYRERDGEVWTFGEFQENIRAAKVDDLIIPLVKTSQEAADDFTQPVELVFVDGDHAHELVKLDFELWFPRVVDGGTMAFHDSAYPWGANPDPTSTGPKRVVEEFVYRSRRFRNVRRVDSITVAQKVEGNTATERLENRYALVMKHLYERDVQRQLQRKVPEPIKETLKRLVCRRK